MKSNSTKVLWLLLLVSVALHAKPYVLSGGKDAAAGREVAGARRDRVAECEELAPEDPYNEDNPDAGFALDACREAAELAPEDAETLYRLGTTALQADQLDEAVESFQKAEQLGHCGALYYLGDAAMNFEKDAARAEEYYKRGNECGDERAAGELFSSSSFPESTHREQLESLYNRDVAKLNKDRFVSACYIKGFYDALSEQYLGPEFNTCWTARYYRGGDIQYNLNAAEKGDASNFVEGMLYENALPIAFQVLVPGGGSRSLEEFREAERKAGYADAIRMVRTYKCGSLIPDKIVKGIEEYAKARRPLIEVVREAAPHIRSHDDLLGWLRLKSRQGAADAPAAD